MTNVGLEYTPLELELLAKVHQASVQLEDAKTLLRGLRKSLTTELKENFTLKFATEGAIASVTKVVAELDLLNDDLLTAFYRDRLTGATPWKRP